MASARGRRFALLDAMVLIGALALCLVIPRTIRALVPAQIYWDYDVRQYWLVIGSCWLLAVSLALAMLAVFVPRPAGRRRFRQPGIMAVVLIALTLAFNEVQTLGHGVTLYLTVGKAFDWGAFWWIFGPIYDLAFRAGLAVLSGWLTLALTGRWRTAAGWLDRSGRFLGWVWIALGLVAWVIECQTLARGQSRRPAVLETRPGLRYDPLMEPIAYDLVVIGSGPAGENGAATAASFGKRVAMVEKSPLVGGASTNTGTLPSKTLRETALAISGLKARDLYGVDLSLRREATVAEFMFHERKVTANERQRVERGLSGRGVMLYHGAASFVDPHTVRVVPEGGASAAGPEAAGAAEVLLRGETILIATGSSPVRPAIFPFEHDRVHDSDEVLQLERLPRSMAVVGAGVIGCEYACTFAALGTKVWIVDGRDELLPFLDAEVSAALEAAMEKQLGIEFLWKRKVVGCDAPAEGDIRLTLAPEGTLAVDAVMVAAGRSSNTAGLDLSAAGLSTGPRGLLTVDACFRTAVPHIYAAGDVIGFPALASTSAKQARVAMAHAFRPGAEADPSPLLPAGIYTIPEVAMVGTSEEDLKAQGVDYVVGRAPYADCARGEIIGDNTGFLKLIFRRADMTLLGVHVIGEQATELVHIGLMAMITGSAVDVFNRACFNFPTLGDLYRDAAADALRLRAARESPG